MLLLSPLVIQTKSFPEFFSTFQIAFLWKEKNVWKSGYRKVWFRSWCLKRCNKLCHSSRVKLLFVRMSASWFLDSTYLIWTWFSVSRSLHFSSQIPQVECRSTIHTHTSIHRYDLWFCGAVRYWRLLLAHPTDTAWCWFLSLQDLLQNLNLEITPIDNVEPHFPHDNIGGNHLWNECRKIIVSIVCHMLETISWEIAQIWWPTTECQVDQFVPGTSTLIQYGSKLLIIHFYFPILPFWFGDRPNKDWKPWKVALSFCLPIRNTVPRIFEHVPPCRRTTLKFSRGVCPILVISRMLQDSNILLYCPMIFSLRLHSRWVHPE